MSDGLSVTWVPLRKTAKESIAKLLTSDSEGTVSGSDPVLNRVFESSLIAVVIPARNEAASLPLVLRSLPLERLHQVIVADNGSTDGTADAARAVSPRITVVREDRPGYGQACLAALAQLAPEVQIVVFIDGDFSDDAADLPLLLAPILANEADFVIGSRNLGRAARGSLTPQQVFGNWLSTTLLWMLWGARWTDLGPFRAIRRTSLDALGMVDQNYGWTIEMQIKAAEAQLRCREVSVAYRPRTGVSKISGTLSGSFRAGVKILKTVFTYWRRRRLPMTTSPGNQHRKPGNRR